MIKTEIIADSLNIKGNRLTTFILEYPRFIHSEFMTHRMFSKNAASSRAIPFEKFVQQIIENPAMPEFWGKNQKGMQANEELDNSEKSVFITDEEHHELASAFDHRQSYHDSVYYAYNLGKKDQAKFIWLEARNATITFARRLNELGLHKQITNRILEPWFYIRVICSATDYENFFALRVHKDAQPEIQKLASLMLEEYNKSEPKKLKEGEWHIPFGDKIDNIKLQELETKIYGERQPQTYYWYQQQELKKKIAVARCARISYFNYEGKDDYESDIKLCDRLFSTIPRHLSPTEHVAMATDNSEYIGNFKGFKQYRKFFNDENLKDNRVINVSI